MRLKKKTIGAFAVILAMLCIVLYLLVVPDSAPILGSSGYFTQGGGLGEDASGMGAANEISDGQAKTGAQNNEDGVLIAYNLLARNDAQYARLLDYLAKMGISPDNSLPSLRAVALTIDQGTLEKILSEIGSLQWEEDYPVSKPIERMSSGMSPFGKSLLDWLKIDKNDTSRGENVKIAIIDEPLTSTESTANASIKQMDMFGLSGQGESSHGNSIASMLVSNSDYLQGIVPGASILSVPIVGSDGSGSSFNLAAAIIAAVDNGVNIISISLCSDGRSNVLENAVKYAKDNGCVVVAAAGNDGEGKSVYPASFTDVISVSACDATGTVASFSNFSSDIDICAPGVGIAVDDAEPDSNSLGYFTGTSAAAPCVAGVIACIMWENPELSATQAAELVLERTVDEGALSRDKFYGLGVVNYQRASRWDDNAFTDAAATGHYFDFSNVRDENIALHLNAQNTGNTMLNRITLNYTVNEQNGSATFYDVAPGTSVGTQISVGLAELEKVKVSTNVETDAEEHNLDNNRKTGIYIKK